MFLFGFSQKHVDKKVNEALAEERKEWAARSEDERARYEAETRRIGSLGDIERNEHASEHRIALGEKEFEIKHIADERVRSADDARTKTESSLAVANRENEMLHRIVDDRADVLEIKDLVKDLLAKIPEIKIDTLAVQAKARNDDRAKS